MLKKIAVKYEDPRVEIAHLQDEINRLKLSIVTLNSQIHRLSDSVHLLNLKLDL